MSKAEHNPEHTTASIRELESLIFLFVDEFDSHEELHEVGFERNVSGWVYSDYEGDDLGTGRTQKDAALSALRSLIGQAVEGQQALYELRAALKVIKKVGGHG